MLGPNWKPFVVQIATALIVGYSFSFLTEGWLPPLIHLGVCTYIIGPC